MALQQHNVNDEVEQAFDRLFSYLDESRDGLKPSELERMLDQASWTLGDDYREWFELSGDPYE